MEMEASKGELERSESAEIISRYLFYSINTDLLTSSISLPVKQRVPSHPIGSWCSSGAELCCGPAALPHLDVGPRLQTRSHPAAVLPRQPSPRSGRRSCDTRHSGCIARLSAFARSRVSGRGAARRCGAALNPACPRTADDPLSVAPSCARCWRRWQPQILRPLRTGSADQRRRAPCPHTSPPRGNGDGGSGCPRLPMREEPRVKSAPRSALLREYSLPRTALPLRHL